MFTAIFIFALVT